MDREFLENTRTPDIKVDELQKVLQSLSYDTYEYFTYNGTNYILLIATKEDIQLDKDRGGLGLEAEFHESTAIVGYDIYLYEGLKGMDRERTMFHEVLEADLKRQGFKEDSHGIALMEEEKVYGSRKE